MATDIKIVLAVRIVAGNEYNYAKFLIPYSSIYSVTPPYDKKLMGPESGQEIDLFNEDIIAALKSEHIKMISEKVAEENKEVLDALKDK